MKNSTKLALFMTFSFILSQSAASYALAIVAPPDVTVQPSSIDAQVESKKPNDKFGTSNDLKVRTSSGDNRRVFIAFNFSSIPSNANITNASLSLYIKDKPNSSRTYDIYRVSSIWTEEGITWNNMPAASSSPTSSANSGTSKDVWVSWNVTSDVFYFYNNPSQNFGWMIRDRLEGNSTSIETVFHSREVTEHSTLRPKLEIYYTISNPENTLAFCSDQIDNDNDSLIDLNDPDCASFIPNLTVTKIVINDNGGTIDVQDFPLYVNGVQVTSGIPASVNASSATITESNQSGYSSTIGGDCAENGTISLAPGDSKSCTITNDDIAPYITINKEVINDNGGILTADDFQLFLDQNPVMRGIANLIMAGLHTVSETPVEGYVGTIGGQCESDGSVSVFVGESKTCIITNDDVTPTITVNKVVVNDNGGTFTADDFSLYLNNELITSGEATTVNAGTYSVTEDGQSGYVGTFSGDCDEQGNITVTIGQNKICTLTNNDQPASLTVNKVVINDNGGVLAADNFPLYVNGVQVINGQATNVNAGWAVVAETNQTGYSATFSDDCSAEGIQLEIGESKSCTITNDDQPSYIRGIKFWDMNGDGYRGEEDSALSGWGINLYKDQILVATTTTSQEGGSYEFTNIPPGIYTVTETEQAGWIQTVTNLAPIELAQGGVSEGNNFGNYKKVIISSETAANIGEDSAIITWDTDKPATSRVVYDVVSHATIGDEPNYGYAFSTEEKDITEKVTSHSVLMSGLSAGVTYYYRVVSKASPASVGSELNFSTSGPASAPVQAPSTPPAGNGPIFGTFGVSPGGGGSAVSAVGVGATRGTEGGQASGSGQLLAAASEVQGGGEITETGGGQTAGSQTAGAEEEQLVGKEEQPAPTRQVSTTNEEEQQTTGGNMLAAVLPAIIGLFSGFSISNLIFWTLFIALIILFFVFWRRKTSNNQ